MKSFAVPFAFSVNLNQSASSAEEIAPPVRVCSPDSEPSSYACSAVPISPNLSAGRIRKLFTSDQSEMLPAASTAAVCQ